MGMSENLSTAFFNGLRQLDLSLSDQQIEQFLQYQQELLDWNTRFNLTAITEPKEIIAHHFQDSLAISTFIDFN